MYANRQQTMVGVVSAVAVAVVLCSTTQALGLTSNSLQLSLLEAAQGSRRVRRTEPGPQPRIIGGSIVTDRCEAPFSSMVALQIFANDPYFRYTHCSGVMIAPDVILTAALCMTPYFSFPIGQLSLILGDKSFDFQDTYQTTAQLLSYKIHPAYNNATEANSLAILKLARPARLNECVQPLPLYMTDVNQCASALMNCTITGWGAYDRYGNLRVNAKNALYGHIRLVDEALSAVIAASPSSSVGFKANTLLGLAYPGWNVQACFMDWGGMAACQVAGRWMLRGIISEHNCDRGPFAPMVLTNLENFRPWIDACVDDFNSPNCQAYMP